MACEFKIKDNPKVFSEEELKAYLLDGGLKDFINNGLLKIDIPQEFLSSQIKALTNENNEKGSQESGSSKENSQQGKSSQQSSKSNEGGQANGDVLNQKEGAEGKTKASSSSSEKKTNRGNKPPIPPSVINDVEDDGEPNIDDYEMTTGGAVNKFLSGETWENVFGEIPEGDQSYEVQHLSDMLQDGKNMIALAQRKWGGDVLAYGKPLFQYLQSMSNDAALTNKKAVLLATFLGELQEAKLREPNRANEIAQLEKVVFAYYQNYMNVRGKEIVAARLLRLYRDKYIGDVFAEKILEEEQVKAKQTFQKAAQDKTIDDKTAQEAMQPINAEDKKSEDQAAKKKTEEDNKKQAKKPKMSNKEAEQRLKSKVEDIKNKVGNKDSLIDRIKDTINKLNCK